MPIPARRRWFRHATDAEVPVLESVVDLQGEDFSFSTKLSLMRVERAL